MNYLKKNTAQWLQLWSEVQTTTPRQNSESLWWLDSHSSSSLILGLKDIKLLLITPGLCYYCFSYLGIPLPFTTRVGPNSAFPMDTLPAGSLPFNFPRTADCASPVSSLYTSQTCVLTTICIRDSSAL